jgi:CubicO group peptidase (beta-lactamase class C family)
MSRQIQCPSLLRKSPERWLSPAFALATLLGLAPAAAVEFWPGEEWATATPAEAGLDSVGLEAARDYARSAGGSGYITRGGRLVMAWGDAGQRYDLKSTTKSIGSLALGLALQDGKVRLEDPAQALHSEFGVPPEANTNTGWLAEVTLLHLATQTAGFEKAGGFTRQLFRPGTMWDYSDSGPNWLAECLTIRYGRDLEELMFERVFGPLGIGRDDLVWRRNQYRPAMIAGVARREFGAGISANVDAMARIGLLMLREGRWAEKQLIPREFVEMARQPVPAFAGLPVHPNSLRPEDLKQGAPRHYGLLWWNNADGSLEAVPRDAYWAWGLYDSVILVIPSLDLVVARAGKSWPRKPGAGHYAPLRPFFEPIVAAAGHSRKKPDGTRIKGVHWAPIETIRRAAKGSDNWPVTWSDDDWLYTAFGDGYGFEPFTDEKLSLGLARVRGAATDFRGENLHSASLERRGEGRLGRKASGLLCLKGVLYLWARNAGNSQLAWSRDHGRTWVWAEWKFTNSFGCPTFVNFGRDYEGNRDGYVYVCSPDAEEAYSAADRFVLARVPTDRVSDGSAYEFYAGQDGAARPRWAADVRGREGILTRRGGCYRPSITFNAALGRFLLVHSLPNKGSRDAAGTMDLRFQGGLAIYEAAQPWGPWRVVYETDHWDMGPGDAASFPAKWISSDGKTLHLVFSGNDCFSVRGATLEVE